MEGLKAEPWNIVKCRGTQEKDNSVKETDGTAIELGRYPGEYGILEAPWRKYFKEEMVTYARYS